MSRTAAAALSRSLRELGGMLASRRVLASISDSPDARLTPTKLRALDVLAETGGVRVGDLAARLYVDETTATRLVDRLERMGVAARERAAGDRRATDVVLTPRGLELVDEMSERREEFFRDVLGALEPGERSELVRLMEKASASMRARTEELAAR
jgi:DNA-binding MarR family transcriptional regulator